MSLMDLGDPVYSVNGHCFVDIYLFLFNRHTLAKHADELNYAAFWEFFSFLLNRMLFD